AAQMAEDEQDVPPHLVRKRQEHRVNLFDGGRRSPHASHLPDRLTMSKTANTVRIPRSYGRTKPTPLVISLYTAAEWRPRNMNLSPPGLPSGELLSTGN